MKNTEDYKLEDWAEIKEQAIKIALASIHGVFHETKEEESPSCEDIKKIHYACEVLDFCTRK